MWMIFLRYFEENYTAYEIYTIIFIKTLLVFSHVLFPHFANFLSFFLFIIRYVAD